MKDIEIIGLGALNIDYLYRVERILVDEEAVVDEPEIHPGGSAANTIYGLARLGVSTGFIGAIGDDEAGKISLDSLKEAGADISQIKVKAGAKTGKTLCLSNRSGQRSIYVMPGANNRLSVDDIDIDYVKQAAIVHVSSFAGEKQFAVLREMINRLDPAVKVSFSPGALYARKGITELTPILDKTHILFLNESEIELLTGESVTAGAGSCIKQGCQLVVVTLGKGKDGAMATSYIRDAENEYRLTPAGQDRATAVETTGAGDAFAAGFLYGFLQNKRLEECGYLGDLVAQFSLSRPGAREGLPDSIQLAEGYRQRYSQEL